jgi:hypothetical protein
MRPHTGGWSSDTLRRVVTGCLGNRLLIQDLHIRVIHAPTGQLLRDLVLDPTRDYQPTGRPAGEPPRV